MDVFGMVLDPGVNIAAQHISPALTLAAVPGELLDSMPWYLLLISVLYLGYHPRHGVRLAVLIGITSGLNEALKLAWHLPRPYWISPEVKAFTSHPSFGFPSGAAMYGAAAYGYIAAAVQDRRAIAVCALLLAATCLVRIFVGAHFVADIIGGLLSGFLLLLVFLWAEPRMERYAGNLSRSGRCAGIIVLAAIPPVLTIPAYTALANWQLPAAWAATALGQTGAAIDPVAIRYAWGAAGVILGSLAGYEGLLAQGGWEPPAALRRRAPVVLAGTGSVLAAWAVAATIPAGSGLPDPVPQVLSVIFPAAVLFWLTCCVPLIARRAGYGRAERSEAGRGEPRAGGR